MSWDAVLEYHLKETKAERKWILLFKKFGDEKPDIMKECIIRWKKDALWISGHFTEKSLKKLIFDGADEWAYLPEERFFND